MLARTRFLARLGARNAFRHRGQTVRAVLGLVIATIILSAGVTLGGSVSASFHDAAAERFGPIDVTVRAQRPVDARLLDALAARAGHDLRGAGSLQLEGAVLNERAGLAEPFAVVRGIDAQEARVLGTMTLAAGGPAPEPATGEAVLSQALARAIGARIGDTVVLRVQPLHERAGAEAEAVEFAGIAGIATGPAKHRFEVRGDATGIAVALEWPAPTSGLRATLRAPSGVEFANETPAPPLSLVVPGPVEEGTWTLTVAAKMPTSYSGRADVAHDAGGGASGAVGVGARVVALVEPTGRAGLASPFTALVPLEDLQRALGLEGQVNAAYYAVPGDGGDAARAMRAVVPEELRGVLLIMPERELAMEEGAQEGAIVGAIVVGMSAFTLLAAILLAFTLFSGLVEERRAELGIARALGLTRRDVALSMTFEGAIYSFAAAALGVVLGVLLVAGVIAWAGDAIAAQTVARAPLSLHLSPALLSGALLASALFPLATIAISSWRLARLEPARALRGLPEHPRARRRGALVGAALLVALGALLLPGDDARVAGVPLVLAGVALGLSGVGRPLFAGLAVSAALAHLAWSLYAFAFVDKELDVFLTFARAALLAIALAAVAVASQAPYEALLRLLRRGGGSSRSAYLGIRYLVARRRPVGFTIAMIALVVVMVTVLSMLLVATSDDERAGATGGYLVMGTASAAHDGFPSPPPLEAARAIERAEFLPRHEEFGAIRFERGGAEVVVADGIRRAIGVTPGFAATNGFALPLRAPAYASDEEAWAAVERGEAIIVPSWAMEHERLRLGERIRMRTAVGGPIDVVVAGGFDATILRWQLFARADDVRAMGFPQTTQIFLRVVEDADATALAHRLSAVHAQEGLAFTSVPEQLAREREGSLRIVRTIEAFLALGLFVGLASTAFLAGRAVRERRREIGTLRALGFEPVDIHRAFMIESTLTAGVGMLAGTITGLVVAHSLWWRVLRDLGVAFELPWLALAGMWIGVLAVAALAARGPARRAAALAPAAAVRHVE